MGILAFFLILGGNSQSFITEFNANSRFLLFLFFNAFYMMEGIFFSLSFQRVSIMNGH